MIDIKNNIYRKQGNRYWLKNEDVYEFHFRPYYDGEIILEFIQDKENVEHDEITADSVKDVMEEFEYMIEEHIEGEVDYYEELLKKFKEE